MSEAQDFHCPNCAAPLSIQGDARTIQCPFCGTQVIVPDELLDKPAPARDSTAYLATMRGLAEASSAEGVLTTPAIPGVQPETKPRRRSSPLGCLGTLAILAILALALGFASKSAGFNALLSGIAGTPTAVVTPFQRPLSSDMPRKVRYGGLTMQITGGVIDNQSTRDNQVIPLADRAFARLKLDMQNTTQEDLYLDPQLFRLKLIDGKVYALDQDIVLMTGFSAPPPGANGNTQLVFDVPIEAQWDGASLVVGTQESELAEIPLTGKVSTDPYPVQVSLPDQVVIATPEMTYKVLSAVVDLNTGSKRAAKNTKFLILDLQMTNTGGKYGLNISSDNYRLAINGLTLAPVTYPIEVVDYQASMNRQVVFMVPVGAKTASLQVGDVRADPNKLGIMQLDLGSALGQAGN